MKSISRRILTLLLAAALLLSLTACGGKKEEPATVRTIIERGQEASADLGSMEFEFSGSMEMSVQTQGVNMNLPVSFEGRAELTADPVRFHMPMSLKLKIMGMSMDVPVDLYVDGGSDPAAGYVSLMDRWMRLPMGGMRMSAIDLSALDKIPQALLDAAELLPETEDIQGKTAWHIRARITQKELQAMAEQQGVEELQGADIPELSFLIDYWYDTETGLPLRMDWKLDEPLSTEEGTLSVLEMQALYTGYGTVEEIVIPQEALDAPEMDGVLDELL